MNYLGTESRMVITTEAGAALVAGDIAPGDLLLELWRVLHELHAILNQLFEEKGGAA